MDDKKMDVSHTLGKWEKIIREIIKGYTKGGHSYTYDLFLRGRIEKFLNNESQDVPVDIKDQIKELDKLFISYTIKLDKPLAEDMSNYWWWYRIPQKIVGELKDEFLLECGIYEESYKRAKTHLVVFNSKKDKEKDIFITLEKWEKVIHEIIEGYDLGYYDYTYDLFLRGRIEKFLNNESQDVPVDIKDQIKELDKLFIFYTIKLDKPLVEDMSNYWWWYRIPQKIVGELRDNFLLNCGLDEKSYEKLKEK